MSSQRLEKEILSIQQTTDWTINVHDLYNWTIQISAPNDSLYKDGKFELIIKIPFEYPFKKPSIRFKTKIFHLNVILDKFDENDDYESGKICMNALPKLKEWMPQYTISLFIKQIFHLLSKPKNCSKCIAVETKYKMEIVLIFYLKNIKSEYYYHHPRSVLLLICRYSDCINNSELIIYNHISDLFHKDRSRYNELAREYTKRYAIK